VNEAPEVLPISASIVQTKRNKEDLEATFP
jgi:hypothetical protein